LKCTPSDVVERTRGLVKQVTSAAEEIDHMRRTMSATDLLLTLRFEKRFQGVDASARKTNVQELLNQATTTLVQLAGCAIIFERHPATIELELAWQETSGWDIRGETDDIVAECYSAVSRTSNKKHKDDLEKLKAAPARHRYLFYHSPRGLKINGDDGGVIVWWVDLREFLNRCLE